MNQDRRGEIRELEKDPEMLEMESRMSQRNRHREQTLSGRDGDTKESNRERRILGEGLRDIEGRETVILEKTCAEEVRPLRPDTMNGREADLWKSSG